MNDRSGGALGVAARQDALDRFRCPRSGSWRFLRNLISASNLSYLLEEHMTFSVVRVRGVRRTSKPLLVQPRHEFVCLAIHIQRMFQVFDQRCRITVGKSN
jgi:hypothetical protein